MKNLIKVLVLFISTISIAQNVSKEQLVNISGKQRMLSQKMAKAYLMKCLGDNSPSVEKDLKHSEIMFQHNMEMIEANLFKYTGTGSATRLEEQKDAWRGFKNLISLEPNQNHAKQVLKGSDILLKKSNAVVQYLSRGNDTSPLLEIINESGRQRMLSQKVCLYYLSSQIINKSYVKENLIETFTLIDTVNKKLMISEVNTDDTHSKLADAMILFEEIRENRKRFFDGKLDNLGIFELSNKLTKKYNVLTNTYSK